jgi:hypothetical protein
MILPPDYHKTYCDKIKHNAVFCKHLIPVTMAKCPLSPWKRGPSPSPFPASGRGGVVISAI